jgi:hypothetical protein
MAKTPPASAPAFEPIFAFAASETYEFPVVVQTPGARGVWEKSTFMAEFRRVEVDEYEELVRQRPADVLDSVLVGWREMRAADKRSFVDYTPEHKAAFLRVPQAVLATFQAFADSQNKARVKN